MLLLEKLAASPTDSVTYYAFAEDNYPAGPKRTETDLRYIDIRPFKREYKKGGGRRRGRAGSRRRSNELIARQRFNLNRGRPAGPARKPTDRSPAEDPLKIAGFEETLVGLTREFTEGIEGIVGERVEPLHQAEEAMLAAVEALDRGRNGEAPQPMSEALRHLIAARRTIQVLIADGGTRRRRRSASSTASQTQKIRKPKNKDDEAEEIADRLEELAKEEDFVYATLAAGIGGRQPAGPGRSRCREGREAAEKPATTEGRRGAEGRRPGKGQGRGKGGRQG